MEKFMIFQLVTSIFRGVPWVSIVWFPPKNIGCPNKWSPGPSKKKQLPSKSLLKDGIQLRQFRRISTLEYFWYLDSQVPYFWGNSCCWVLGVKLPKKMGHLPFQVLGFLSNSSFWIRNGRTFSGGKKNPQKHDFLFNSRKINENHGGEPSHMVFSHPNQIFSLRGESRWWIFFRWSEPTVSWLGGFQWKKRHISIWKKN